MTAALFHLVVLALAAAAPEASTVTPAAPQAAPTPAPVAAPADFIAEARALMRTVTCQGDGPLPHGFDEATVAAYCRKQSKAITSYRDRYLPLAAPFLARLRPAGTPTTVVYPFGGGDLVSALTTYPDARDLTTLSLEHAGDPRRLSAIASKEQLAGSLELIRARRVVEGVINDAKLGRRVEVRRIVRIKAVYHKVFDVLAPRYKERPGGCTRILRLGARKGDATEVAMIKLVD